MILRTRSREKKKGDSDDYGPADMEKEESVAVSDIDRCWK